MAVAAGLAEATTPAPLSYALGPQAFGNQASSEPELASALLESCTAIRGFDWTLESVLPESLRVDSFLPPPSGGSFESLTCCPVLQDAREGAIDWFAEEAGERASDASEEADVVWSPLVIDGVEFFTLSDSELAAIGGLR